jgi:uncharacterized protein YciI
MRFLVIMVPVEAAVTNLKPQRILKIITSHVEYLEDLRAQGKVVESGSFAGLRGGFGILEVESLKELNDIVNLDPAMPYMQTEIYPIITGSDRIEQLKKRLQMEVEKEELSLAQETPR